MSVITTADEKLNSAVDSLNSAIANLSEIVIDRCWGHDDYTTEFKEVLSKSMFDLIQIRDALEK